MSHPPVARAAIRALANSKIREVANAGMGRAGVLPFWFGEPDQVTPAFIRDAAIASINAGETFYNPNLGIPELRAALATYVARLHGHCEVDNIAVTNSGMNALMLCFQALIAPGDRVVAVTPLWPNLIEGPKILAAQVAAVPLAFDARLGWRLDLDQLLAALTPQTRVLIINSPNNPTGWTLPRAEQQVILDRCRARGIWILADDTYDRLYYGAAPGAAAPSFLDIAAPEDPVGFSITFEEEVAGPQLTPVDGTAAMPEPVAKAE